MAPQVKSHPANVGKMVEFTIARGDIKVQRIGTIAQFRGGRLAHAAFVQYRSPSGSLRVTCIELENLRYV